MILMDDAARADRQEIAGRWTKECDRLEARYFATERGLLRLERR